MKKQLIILICVLLIIGASISTILLINYCENKVSEKIWAENETVNKPVLLKGMKAIGFEEGNEAPIILEENEMVEGIWYDYISQQESTENGGTSKWANAMTEDGSMWVWIPRYAYKIVEDKEMKAADKIEIVFLDGTTNYNKEGIDVTTLGYIVHPAFIDGKTNNYMNGEWDKEITGIWVSKFEAGYAGQEKTASKNVEIIETDLQYLRDAENVIGEIKNGETYISYPVFMGKTYSYNNIEIGEMYDLSRILTQNGNPYGFDETIDSHLIKNSEWGAITYLAHSEYGRNGTKVSINNMDVSEVMDKAKTVTGYAGKTISSVTNIIEEIDTELRDSYNDKSYAWYTEIGKLGSTTGNLYGIYDMNGASSEYIAGYIDAIDEEKGMMYAKSMVENRISTKYYTVYKSAVGEENSNSTNENYEANKNIYGDAIVETSQKGSGYTAWFGETSVYIKDDAGFFLRSGGYDRVNYSGLFDFTNHSGHSYGSYSFRCVLIEK